MTDKRDTARAPRAGRQFAPTAAEVAECPPHWWLIEGKWQQCRKCGARMEVPTPVPASAARTQARREPATAAAAVPAEPIAAEVAEVAKVDVVEEAEVDEVVEEAELDEVAEVDEVEEPEAEPPAEGTVEPES